MNVYADIGWDFIAGNTTAPQPGSCETIAEDYSARKVALSLADVHLLIGRLKHPYAITGRAA